MLSQQSIVFPQDRAIEWNQLIDEDLFRDALLRERRRAERFDTAFVLILISHSRRTLQQTVWGHLIDALSRTTMDTDVIGWFKQDSVLGLIRALDLRESREAVRALTATVHRELGRCLTPVDMNSCSIHLEVYSHDGDAIPPILLDDENRRRQEGRARDTVKRSLDVAGSMALLIAFSPVFLCVSVLVKLTSKGPVFYRQQRVGERGRPFTMLKFRTMYVDVDHRIHQQYVEKFIQSPDASQSGKNTVFKIVDDPRVTSLGRWLRRWSLDEFPQFWNVLRGDMSLVGPRPPLPYEVARYKRWHRRRVLEAKPGITGLWQVNGRSRTTFDEMVRLDLRYAKSHSIWTDLRILLATPQAVISGKGAH